MLSKFQPENEFDTEERCYIVELFNKDIDESCSIARARVEAGITTELHALKNTVERYVIIEGEGLVEIDGAEPQAVGPMDVVYINKEVSQRITNTGHDDLIFLAVCTPRFRPENYFNPGS